MGRKRQSFNKDFKAKVHLKHYEKNQQFRKLQESTVFIQIRFRSGRHRQLPVWLIFLRGQTRNLKKFTAG